MGGVKLGELVDSFLQVGKIGRAMSCLNKRET